MHLAQFNVATARYDSDDPRIAEFMDGLDLVNGLAERADGFVWRHQDESGNSTSVVIGGNPRILVNFSVWKTPEDLERFVWLTVHKKFYGKREAWFEPHEAAHLVMWWIDETQTPTIDEAVTRLEHLRTNGPTEFAFGWESLDSAKLWQQHQCA